MSVYTGSGLPEDNNPTSCVCRLYYDCLGRDPFYPSFYMLKWLGFTWKIWPVTIVPNSDSISTCPIYKIWFYRYLLNRLSYGSLGLCPKVEWADSWLAPCFVWLSRGDVVPMVPDLISSPWVLGKRALILVNQIFLLWWSCRVLCSIWNNLLIALWL
jgi:hypothetical protein